MINYLSQKAAYQFRKRRTELLCHLGAKKWLLADRPGARILLYHGIDQVGQLAINGRFLSAKRFEEQLIFLKENYKVVPLSELFYQKDAPQSMTIALAFDDGYQNNLSIALPILEKHQLPATFFVTAINDTPYPMLWADYLDLATFVSSQDIKIDGIRYRKRKGSYWHPDGRSLKQLCKTHDWSFKQQIYKAFPEAKNLTTLDRWKPYWKTLSDAEIRQLDASPWATIGLHAYYHDNLGILPHQQAIKLIEKGKYYLENILQRNIESIAYADGSYTRNLIDYAERLGLQEQYAVDYLFPEDEADTRIKSRLTINPYTSLPHQVWATLHGKY